MYTLYRSDIKLSQEVFESLTHTLINSGSSEYNAHKPIGLDEVKKEQKNGEKTAILEHAELKRLQS